MGAIRNQREQRQAINAFFIALVTWRNEISAMHAQYRQMWRLAKARPNGAYIKQNLMRDSDGNVWMHTRMSVRGDVVTVLCRVTRCRQYASYETTRDIIPLSQMLGSGLQLPWTFREVDTQIVERATDCPNADWVWVNDGQEGGAEQFYAEQTRAANNALSCANTILNRRKDVEQWMLQRARQTAGHRAQRDPAPQQEDVRQFRRFLPRINGQIYDMTRVHVHLHISLDWLAGQKGCKEYAF